MESKCLSPMLGYTGSPQTFRIVVCCIKNKEVVKLCAECILIIIYSSIINGFLLLNYLQLSTQMKLQQSDIYENCCYKPPRVA